MSESDPEHEDISPNDAQEDVIDCDEYPQRVLAGAGTGKTYTMVEKIRTLIEEKDVPPEEILALTFTNQAAESMRAKLAETIGPRANDIDAYTYHAIGNAILSEFGYYGSFDPRAELAGEVEQLKLVYDCLDEIDYDFTSPQVSPPNAQFSLTEEDLSSFITEAKSEGVSPEEVAEYLPDESRLVELGELPERIERDARELLRDQTKPTSAEQLETAIENVRAFIDRLEEHRDRLGDSTAETDVAAFLQIFVELCETIITAFEDNESAILDGEYAAFGRVPAYLFNTYSRSATGVERLSTTPLDRLNTFVEELQAAHDFADGYDAYEAALDDADLMDYDDLVIEAERLLANNESVREWVTDRWSYVFCDEFQDTDSIQFDLIQQIATDANLFVVGDDDQSIYEWRGANTSNITDDFRAAYPDFVDFELEQNYRSREPILSLADDAIAQLDRRESTKALKPTEEREGAETGVAVLQEEDPSEEAAQIAGAIDQLRAGDAPGVPDQFDVGDVAILVRNADHARPIRNALTDHGIPYELVGGLTSASTGVETIAAYLRVLVNHDDEVSLNRVLTLCYRLPESDLVALNREDNLWNTLQTCESNEYDDPEGIRRARRDLRELTAAARTLSISKLYEKIKERTRLDIFLREDERRELRYFDELVEGFDDSPIEVELNEAFIEYLEFAATSVSEGSGVGDQPEISDEVVTIMTVHKAKGLEFPVVFVPRLESDEWSPRNQSFRHLKSALTSERANDGGPSGPAPIDFLRRQRDEQQRVFHVAVTRAQSLLVLSGSGDDDNGSEKTVSAETIEDLYPDYVEWKDDSTDFDVWELVVSTLPDSAVNWTGHTWVTDEIRPALRDGDAMYGLEEANDRLVELARGALEGELDTPASEVDTDRADPATRDIKPRIRQEFSYTSIDTYRTCPRQYYLDYVVDAFEDSLVDVPEEYDGWSSDGPSRRVIGALFHRTAEEAAGLDHTDRGTWRSIAEQLASSDQRADDRTLEAVYDCIDRYFESKPSDWTPIESERRFKVEFPHNVSTQGDEVFPVIGAIDAIYRDGLGDYVVVDYKTGHGDTNYDLQRAIYVLAANQFIGEEAESHRAGGHHSPSASGSDTRISRAGILNLGPDGPSFDEAEYSAAELEMVERSIITELQDIRTATYDEFHAGDHCRYCAHASLPCSPYSK